MRWRLISVLFVASLLGGCPETVRCDEGEVFNEEGECGPIPDAGQSDAGGVADAGT